MIKKKQPEIQKETDVQNTNDPADVPNATVEELSWSLYQKRMYEVAVETYKETRKLRELVEGDSSK